MPTIKHGSIVNKTFFWTRNVPKIAGTADFRRKNSISWISGAVLYIYSWNVAHRCKMEKDFFSVRKCRKYAGKTRFSAFSRDFTIRFFWLFAQRCILGLLKTWPSPIFEKNFFRWKIPEITGNRRLFPYISLFFHTNISYNNVHHQAWLNCQYNWFLLPEFSKNPRNSWFSPEKWHFLNFSSCASYFFNKFCTLIRNGNAQKVTFCPIL